MFTRSILNSYHEEVNLTELPIMASVHGSLILHFLGLETLLQPQVFPQAPSGNIAFLVGTLCKHAATQKLFLSGF